MEMHFCICFLSDHNEISMADANIDALYASCLRIENNIFLIRIILHFICGA